jgi:hypothetical protein
VHAQRVVREDGNVFLAFTQSDGAVEVKVEGALNLDLKVWEYVDMPVAETCNL